MSAIYEMSPPSGSLRQGEIITGLIQAKLVPESINTEPKMKPELHPYVIVVTQDCDLEWDYQARFHEGKKHRLISDILFCKLVIATDFIKDDLINSRVKDLVKSHKDERYHFLEKVSDEIDHKREGLPELVAEFRSHFTIPVAEFYMRLNRSEIQRRCKFKSPYLEHFIHRFYYYNGRIGLPEPYRSE